MSIILLYNLTDIKLKNKEISSAEIEQKINSIKEVSQEEAYKMVVTYLKENYKSFAKYVFYQSYPLSHPITDELTGYGFEFKKEISETDFYSLEMWYEFPDSICRGKDHIRAVKRGL